MKQEGQIESIRSRLLNLSRENGETFDYVLARYGIERVLFRLGKSDAADRFVLKGATLFHVWNRKLHRPTRDLDLLGCGPDDLESLRNVILDIIRIPCPEDGLTFDEDSLSVAPIRDDMDYGGVRAKFRAMLGNVRIPIQVDIGFGDAITPGPETRDYPTLLGDMPCIALKTYPTCSVIAEKFETLVRLDAQNSRMKDFFDLDFLLSGSAREHPSLKAAIRATFARRGSVLPTENPTGLSKDFVEDRRDMWQAFLRKNGLQADGFDEVVARIRSGLEWMWKS